MTVNLSMAVSQGKGGLYSLLGCYVGYQALLDSDQEVKGAVRSKFFKLFTANKSLIAKLALDTNRELYKVERKIIHRLRIIMPMVTALCEVLVWNPLDH
ncbi:hypothetical protein ABIE12_002159 [Serratia sp. 509]